ncbi:hypothetical protein CLAIMM_11168 [Cladophialophora immunda]|nr:hypothetical protein CLAIMM_11168 [Cladophialophora immunda]
MSPYLYLLTLLSVYFSIARVNAKACPPWVTPYLTNVMARHPEFPGIQLALSSQRCGYDCKTSVNSNLSHFADEPPYLEDTPWRIASITKTFTASATLRLVEQNKLNLHAPVVNFLPAWAVNYLEQEQGVSNASQITSWMLLHHISGLGDHATDPRWLQEVTANPEYRWTQQTILAWAAANVTGVGYPGERYYYSDTGFTYLGLVVENLTDLGLAEAVRTLLRLDTLDMPSTYWEILEPTPKNVLARAGQYLDGADATHADASFDLYGAGGLVSNSGDLNNFTRALHTGRVLNNASLQLMFTTEKTGYSGCGIFNDTFAGQQAWGHRGFWASWTYYVPALDLYISGTDGVGADQLDMNALVESVIHHGCRPVKIEDAAGIAGVV